VVVVGSFVVLLRRCLGSTQDHDRDDGSDSADCGNHGGQRLRLRLFHGSSLGFFIPCKSLLAFVGCVRVFVCFGWRKGVNENGLLRIKKKKKNQEKRFKKAPKRKRDWRFSALALRRAADE
jgi:hypothetical protein